MSLSQDQWDAIKRHVVTSIGAAFVGGSAVAVAMGKISQADADHLVALGKQVGESIGLIVTAVGAIATAAGTIRAVFATSPANQVKAVEQRVDGVITVPTTQAGADLIKQATGQDKPIT